MLGSVAPTKAELAHMGLCKERVCVICLQRVAAGLLPAQWAVVGNPDTPALYYGLLQYHHTKSGNIRRGHLAGFAMCEWHHEGIPPQGFDKYTAETRWGPSLKGGSRTFHETYGSDDELIEIQQLILTGEIYQ